MNHCKRIFRGTIPYFFSRIFTPASERLPYLAYIHKYGYKGHIYTCRHLYKDFNTTICLDEEKGLHYVTDRGRRLYFKRDLPTDKIFRLYRELIIEQDARSPHHYFENMEEELAGRVLLDAGASEGLIALRAIDAAKHIVLLENDPGWVEALKATFGPYAGKVTLIQGTVSDSTAPGELTLDSVTETMKDEKFFLKMDIEGYEPKALRGARRLLTAGDCRFAVCTYHGNEAPEVESILAAYGRAFTSRQGYFSGRIKNVIAKG